MSVYSTVAVTNQHNIVLENDRLVRTVGALIQTNNLFVVRRRYYERAEK